MDDPRNLQRFLDAQDSVVEAVCSELKAGQKRTHWMWFIFPQIRGLGQSSMSLKYSISSREEAAAFLAHPVLGPRLRECTALVNRIEGRSARDVFGYPDDMKFQSSMTLFSEVEPAEKLFSDALSKYFNGIRDKATLARL